MRRNGHMIVGAAGALTLCLAVAAAATLPGSHTSPPSQVSIAAARSLLPSSEGSKQAPPAKAGPKTHSPASKPPSTTPATTTATTLVLAQDATSATTAPSTTVTAAAADPPSSSTTHPAASNTNTKTNTNTNTSSRSESSHEAAPPETTPTTAASPPQTLAPRTTPSAAQVEAAIEGLSQYVHSMLTPTPSEVAEFGDLVCTALDEGQTASQIEATIMKDVQKIPFTTVLPGAGQYVVTTAVQLYCPGYDSKVG